MARVTMSDGVSINTRVDGDGEAPWIVLSNSLGADLSMWDGQIELLTRKYRVLRYDQRGHGKSDAPGGDYTWDQLISDVVGIMEHHDIDRADWLGLSMGAMTGMGLALSHPDRFGRMVLANARAVSNEAYRAMWDQRIAAVTDGGTEAIANGSLGLWFTEEWRAANPEATQAARKMIAATEPSGYVGCCRALKELNYFKDLGKITRPVIYISGDQDKGAPPEEMQAMAAATPDAEYINLADAGHVANINQPDLFNAAVADFLRV